MEKRIEKKFVYKNGDETFKLFILDTFLKKTFPSRVVNTIYFDTNSFHDIWDNINGFSNRKKIRVRWYDQLDNSDVFIEEKKKINFLTQKKVDKIGNFKDFNELKKFLLSEKFLNHEFIVKHKRNIKQTIRNQYTRDYFEISNKKLRVTIDKNLKIFNDDFNFLNLDDVILELKYSVDNSTYVNDLIYKYNFNNRNKKYSKYVNSFLIFNESGFF